MRIRELRNNELQDLMVTLAIAHGAPDPIKEVRDVQERASIRDIARDIAAKRGINVTTAYREARKVVLAQEPQVPEGWSLRDYVLEAMLRINSHPGSGTDAIKDMLHAMGRTANDNELTGTIWNLNKAQLVTFSEKKTQHGSSLTRIRLTTQGRKLAIEKRIDREVVTEPPAGAEYAGPKMKPGSSRRSRQVGTDMTQAINHGTTAQGGPVEVIAGTPVVEPVIEGHEPEIELPKLGGPLPQNMKAPLAGSVPIVIDEINLPSFRTVWQLLEHRDERNIAKGKAAKLVEAATAIADIDPDGAETLMQHAADMEGPSFSDLEKDVLRMVDTLRGIPEAFRQEN